MSTNNRQVAVIVGYRYYSTNTVKVTNVLQNDFDKPELAPRQHQAYGNNEFKKFKPHANVIFTLVKAPGSTRRYLGNVIELSESDFQNIKTLWESKMFKIDRNGKITQYVDGQPVLPESNDAKSNVEDKAVTELKPQIGGYMYIPDDINETFYFADAQRRANPDAATKILMVGPSGYGKSSLPRAYATKCGIKFIRVDCATIRDPEEWFGQRVAVNGSTQFNLSVFAKTIMEGNVVVLLDEINRLETWLTNSLYAILDDARGTTVYDGVEIKVGPNTMFVATLNLGHNYSGTFSIDAALSNRFEYVCEVGNIPFDKEIDVLTKNTSVPQADARTIVTIADQIRALNGVECSIRTTLMISRQVALGMSVRNSFQTAVVLRCSNQTLRKQVVDIVNRSGIYKPKKRFF